MGICHGDFNQHNVVFRSEYAAVISFDNICYDVQIGDLARFMRKILEKNNWNMIPEEMPILFVAEYTFRNRQNASYTLKTVPCFLLPL